MFLAKFPFKEGIASVCIPLPLFPSGMEIKVLKSNQIVLRMLTLSLHHLFLLQKSFSVCEWHARGSRYRRYKPSELTESYIVDFCFLLTKK